MKTSIIVAIALLSISSFGDDPQFFRGKADVPTRINNFTISSNISMNIVAEGTDPDACIESTFSLTNSWFPYKENINLNIGENIVELPKLEYHWQEMSGAFLSKQHGIWETTTKEKWIESAFGLGEAILEEAIAELLHATKFLGPIGKLKLIMDQIPSAGGSIVIKNDLELTANAIYLEDDDSFVQEWYKITVGSPLLPICVTSPKWSTDHEEINPETGQMDYVAEYTKTLEIKVLEYDDYFGYEVWHSYTNINLLNDTEAKFIVANYYLVPNQTLSLPVGKYEIKWGSESKRVKIYPVDGLVAYYPFDGNAQDYSGNGIHGTVNGATLTAGVSGQAYSFDGINDYIDLTTKVIPTTGSFTVSLWAKQTSSQSLYREIISQGYSSSSGFYIGHDRSRNFRVGDSIQNTGVAFPSVGVWHHYVVTVDSDSEKTTLYVDGSSVLNRDFSILMTSSGANTIVGNQFPPCSEYFKGIIDQIRVYDYPLSLVEIQNLRQNTK